MEAEGPPRHSCSTELPSQSGSSFFRKLQFLHLSLRRETEMKLVISRSYLLFRSGSLLQAICGGALPQWQRHARRQFHRSPIRSTDGVYKALTEMRVRTPWVEALRNSQKEAGKPTEPPASYSPPDMTPKKMSDSYHRVVSLSTGPGSSLTGQWAF